MLLSNKSIFVVEDNPQNRVVFQMALIRHGAVLNFERWGKDAIFRLKNVVQVDLIILDLMLAENTSGLDIFDQIRALPKYADVPIIAVSAMDPALAIPKVRAKGFTGFIAKPIDSRLFARQIADIIAGKEVWHVGGREYTQQVE